MPACTHMMFIELALGFAACRSFRESRERDKTNLGYFTLVEDFEELSEHTERAHHNTSTLIDFNYLNYFGASRPCAISNMRGGSLRPAPATTSSYASKT